MSGYNCVYTMVASSARDTLLQIFIYHVIWFNNIEMVGMKCEYSPLIAIPKNNKKNQRVRTAEGTINTVQFKCTWNEFQFICSILNCAHQISFYVLIQQFEHTGHKYLLFMHAKHTNWIQRHKYNVVYSCNRTNGWHQTELDQLQRFWLASTYK